MQSAELELFGKDVKSAPEYGRVVNASHFKRLTGILDSQLAQNKKSKVVLGGKNMFDESSLFMPLTVVSGVELNLEENPMMTGELFGPLLPIITVLHHQEAIDYINSRDKPLSVYVMTRNKKLADNFLNQTTSGCAMVNDLIMNMAIHELPFGGVGSSGMGSYHGKSGFDTFSHMRSVMIRPSGMEFLNAVRYPPFSPLQWKVILTALGKKVPMKDSFMIKFVGKLIKTFGPFVLFTAIGFGIGWFTRI